MSARASANQAVVACVRQVWHPHPRSRVSLVVGVSGGADSLALLHALARSKPPSAQLAAVHVHHGLRGRSADRDAATVRALCATLGVPCRVYAFPVKTLAYQRKKSLEETGREVRQEAFLDAARAVRAHAVVVAHHQDDQIETLLLNLIRGTALKGLGGMPESRPFPHPAAPRGLRLLRPLLTVSKRRLIQYCQEHHLVWREDTSNQDVRFLRNRIRQRLLPLLEKQFNPQIRMVLSRTAESVGKDHAWLEACAEKHLTRWVRFQPGNEARWTCSTWRRLAEPLRLEVLSLLWARLGMTQKTFQHLTRLDQVCLNGTGVLPFPGGWRAEVKGSAVRLFRPSTKINAHKLNRSPAYGVERKLCAIPPRVKTRSAGGTSVLVDADKVKGEITVRFKRPGDRMCPLGLQGHHKDIKKILSEMQVPVEARAQWPLVVSGKEILWVFRGPVADRVKLDSGSRRALRIQLTRKASTPHPRTEAGGSGAKHPDSDRKRSKTHWRLRQGNLWFP